jgi:poly-gamma-glutamate capsule biosynthesis protein CapA/YwtB (metallophosphatase superfamily)/putative cell wall-binding protein
VRRTAAVLVAAVVAALVPPLPGLAEPDLTPARVAGAARIETAARLAELGFSSAHAAVLARADDFPDALAGAALAGSVEGPVLLTHPDRLPETTRQVLQRLGVVEVLLLGDRAAISETVEAELAAGHHVRRLAGANRYATAAAVAREVGPGVLGGRATVLVASGERFPDALAAGGAAYAGPHPVLLTTADELPGDTATAIRDLAPEHALVLGGPAAVGDGVLEEIRALGVEPVRVAGQTRTATATALARHFAEQGLPPAGVLLARGDDFADALAAGPFAGRNGAAVLLAASPAQLGPDAQTWLAERCGETGPVQVAGGSAAVSEQVLSHALRAARVCRPGLPVRLRFSVGAEPGSGVDPEAFAGFVTGVLGDERGWADPGLLEFVASSPGDLDFAVVAGAAPTARVGDTLHVEAARWLGASDDERRRTVNDLVGHWLGAADHVAGPWPTATQQQGQISRYVDRVTVAFAGDVHGEGVVGQRLRAGENPLAPMAPVLSDADVAVVNLETAVGTVGRPASKEYVFRAPPELVTALAGAGVDVVSLANNHALDYGVDGLFETMRLAQQAGLAVVGAGRDAAEAYAPALLEAGGRRVAVIGLSRVLPPGWAAGPGRPGLASAYDEAAAVDAVRRAAEQADHVVVTIHWGVELADCPDAHQRRLGRVLTDAGAEVVAGHHPHVLQGIQRQPGGVVAYSLGNFVWYHRREPSRYTGVLTADLPAHGSGYRFSPAEIDAAGSPQPAHGALAAAIEDRVVERSPGGGRCAF